MSTGHYGLSTYDSRKEQTTTVEQVGRFTVEYYALFTHAQDVATYQADQCYPTLVLSSAFHIKMNDILVTKAADPFQFFLGLDRYQTQELPYAFKCLNGMFKETRLGFFGIANTESREEDASDTQRSQAVITGTGSVYVPLHNTGGIDRNKRISVRKPHKVEVGKAVNQPLSVVLDQMDHNEWSTAFKMINDFREQFENEMAQYSTEDEKNQGSLQYMRRILDKLQEADAQRIPDEGTFDMSAADLQKRKAKKYTVQLAENQRTSVQVIDAYRKDVHAIFNKHLMFGDSTSRQKEMLILYHYAFDALMRVGRGNIYLPYYNVLLVNSMLHGIFFVAISSNNCMSESFMGFSLTSALPGEKLDVLIRSF